MLALVVGFLESNSGNTDIQPGLGRAVTGLLQAAPGHLPSGTTSLALSLPAGAQPSRGQDSVPAGAGGRVVPSFSAPAHLKLGQPCSERRVPASSISP